MAQKDLKRKFELLTVRIKWTEDSEHCFMVALWSLLRSFNTLLRGESPLCTQCSISDVDKLLHVLELSVPLPSPEPSVDPTDLIKQKPILSKQNKQLFF